MKLKNLKKRYLVKGILLLLLFCFAPTLYAQEDIELNDEETEVISTEDLVENLRCDAALELCIKQNIVLRQENDKMAEELEGAETSAYIIFGSGTLTGILLVLGVLLL